MNITIRLLGESDAKTSYIWRSDPEIWRFTGSKPNLNVSYEIEQDWIKTVLKRKDEIRFAICVGSQNEYVGNVQLTKITTEDAEFHIFIGKKEFHNQGIGSKATDLILQYAFDNLNLQNVFLFVNKDNIAAIKSYKKCGFKEIETSENELKLIIKNNK